MARGNFLIRMDSLSVKKVTWALCTAFSGDTLEQITKTCTLVGANKNY